MRSRAVYILSPWFKCTTGAKNCHQPKSRTLTTPKAGGMWSCRNAHALLVGMPHGTVTLEDSLVTFYKTKHTLTTWFSNHTLCNHLDCSPGLAQLLCPWDFPGKNTGVDCHFLLQGIFLMQGSDPGLLHYRWILYYLSHLESQTDVYRN